MHSLKPLTQEQRQSAYEQARKAVIRSVGEHPKREHFTQHAVMKYPPIISHLINLLCIVLLLAAFTPSAIRLFVIGSETFGAAVPDQRAMIAVGIATVLTAEISQVVFSLALATLGTSANTRRLLYTSMGIATMIALVGNVQVALPGHHTSPFAWLEAIAPPLLVLSTAYVLKSQLLETIEMRHANERAFQEAVRRWQQATAKPEAHPQWMQFYANALRDALRKANSRRKETLSAMTTQDWRQAIQRELQADQWYLQPTVVEQKVQVSQPAPLAQKPNQLNAKNALSNGGA